MPLQSRVISQIIKYLSGKLAENESFQRLSLSAHEKVEGMRRSALNEISNSDPTQTSIHGLLNKMIQSGKDFLKKS